MSLSKNIFYIGLALLFAQTIFAANGDIVGRDTICRNLKALNSTEDDYAPFLMGKKHIFFTSTRKTLENNRAIEYSEKAYFSKRRGKTKWFPAEPNGFKWNSDNNTALLGVDATRLYFYRAYWLNNGELYYSERYPKERRNPWRAKKLKELKDVNSSYDECSITSISPDSLLFVSNRNGNHDIFLKVTGQKPQPIKEINSPAKENDLYFSAYNRTLYFSSNRPNGYGGYDIYSSKFENGKFSAPELLPDTFINTKFDDRDFHIYNDTLMFLASNREGGIGKLDIYQIDITSIREFEINIEDERTIRDQRDELNKKLKELGLFPFKGEVQIGAYRYIKSLEEFDKRFPCIVDEDIKIQKITVDKKIVVHKYIINKVYTDVEEALEKQFEIEAMHCLPEKEFSDMPFIGVLDNEGNRYAIFWKKDEFVNKNIFYLFKNGKQIWKSRKF